MLAPLSSFSRDNTFTSLRDASSDSVNTRDAVISRDDMEGRRLAAAQDLLNGSSQATIARKYRVSRTTASRWHRSIVHSGLTSLKKRRATGRPSRLDANQIDAIRKMYFEGAMAHGFSAERWTTGRLAEAIQRQFGIQYDQDHVGRLMHKFGLRERKFVYSPASHGMGADRYPVTPPAL